MINPNLISRRGAIAGCALLLIAAVAWAGPAPRNAGEMEVGMMIEVEGRALGARMVLADEIEVLRFAGASKFEGAIQAIDAETKAVTVLGIKVVTSADTRFEQPGGMPLEFAALKQGQVIEVKGAPGGTDGFAASKLEIVEEMDIRANHATLEAQIEEVDASANSVVMLGVKVKLTPKTEIEAE